MTTTNNGIDPDLKAVTDLLDEADARGWSWVIDVEGDKAGWSLTGPLGTSKARYMPGDGFGVGTVTACTPGTTFHTTGVSSAQVAVRHVRDFLGWRSPVVAAQPAVEQARAEARDSLCETAAALATEDGGQQ